MALLLAPLGAYAEDPDAFRRRFTPQEQIILSAVLADRAAFAEFATDAQNPDAAAMTKWRAKAALYAKGYLSKEHLSRFQDAQGRPIRNLKDAVEPGEWAALMYTLELMASGDAVQRGKMKIFAGMIKSADAALKTDAADRTEEAADVIKLGRDNLREALTEFVNSEAAKTALAEYERTRGREKQEADRRALEQARQEEETARRAAHARTPEDAADRAGTVTDGKPQFPGPQPVVVGTPGSPEIAGGLPALPPPQQRSNLKVDGVPAPGGESALDDMAKLDKLSDKAGDPFAAYAIGAGAVLGAVAGGLAAGPLGIGLALGILGGMLLGGLLGWGVKKAFLE